MCSANCIFLIEKKVCQNDYVLKNFYMLTIRNYYDLFLFFNHENQET